MSQYLETIRIQHRKIQNLKWHNRRINNTLSTQFGIDHKIDLNDYVNTEVLSFDDIYKCRIVYGSKIESISFFSYKKPKITSLKLTFNNELDYHFKYLNRLELKQLFKLRDKADDIIIIRNDLVTDSYYCNVAFWNGSTWLTPNEPLLKGTQRARCLELGLIKEQQITKTDIQTFEKICLFNAMIPFEEKIEIEIDSILT